MKLAYCVPLVPAIEYYFFYWQFNVVNHYFLSYCITFVLILGAVAKYNGFSISLIKYIKDELWLVPLHLKPRYPR